MIDKLKKLFLIFIATYPIFDMQLFYNSYTTLGRIVFLGLLLIMLLIYDKDSRKNLKYLIIYGGVVLVYFFFHHLNALNFKSVVPDNFNYSVLDEFLQIIKISIPVLVIYLLKCFKITKEDYIKVIKCLIFIICGSIIITNFFEISSSSYGLATIKGNIFDWFSEDYIYNELASVGFFVYANQISCILICLLPVVYYLVLNKKLKLFYLIMIMLTLLLLGTRTSNLGGIIVLIVLLMISIFFKLIKKNNLDLNFVFIIITIIILYGLMLPFSPTDSRSEIYNLKGQVELVMNENFSIDKALYIENNYEDLKINENFIINSYPYQYDVDFWYDILQLEESKRIDYRFLEISMVKRVVEINDNKIDSLLGITNSRIQNIFNIERDFVLQYYAYGILGCILFLGIYIVIFVKKGIEVLKNFNLYSVINYSVIFLFLGISFFSGNILNQLAVPILMLFLLGVNYEEV